MFSTFRTTTLAAIVAVLGLLAAGGAKKAHANLLLFSFQAGSDTASWEQSSTPTPASSFSVLTTIAVQSGTETISGVSDAVTSVSFRTLNPTVGGFITNPSGNADDRGPQLFTGTTQNPVFAAGTYLTQDATAGPGTLIVTDLSTLVPEPASLTLLAMGFAGLGVVLRRRRA